MSLNTWSAKFGQRRRNVGHFTIDKTFSGGCNRKVCDHRKSGEFFEKANCEMSKGSSRVGIGWGLGGVGGSGRQHT